MLDVREIEFAADLGAWKLRSAQPDDSLRHVVREYWEVEGSLRPFRETLLPNGACEIMFNLGPIHEVHSDQGRGFWTDSWLSGLHERSLIIESLNGTHLVSARLHPLGVVEILGETMARWANGIVRLDEVIGQRAADVRAQMLSVPSATLRLELLEQLLRELATSQGRPIPEFLHAAVRAIENAHGALRVSELHEQLGVSRRHLSVTFTRYIGISPKRYAAIQRFVWALDQIRGKETVDWSTLAIDAGYSDQSHLVRDFKRVGAATPQEYLRRSTPDGAALIDE